MNKPNKILLGILSFVPLALALVIIVFVINMVFNSNNPLSLYVFSDFVPIIIIGVLASMCSVGLLIYYIIDLTRERSMADGEKIMWILLFLFAPVIAYPVYFFIRVYTQSLDNKGPTLFI
ncbi:MAG TPA: PLDc N-terminal domain-containing protein [Flavipsychrobacter sp.]|nr:PLDc N-terminal domain-containing protein [Flavipsychrobacter sp.]